MHGGSGETGHRPCHKTQPGGVPHVPQPSALEVGRDREEQGNTSGSSGEGSDRRDNPGLRGAILGHPGEAQDPKGSERQEGRHEAASGA
jgi:hypothetical protein